MEVTKLQSSLLKLNPLESIGKKHFEVFGKNISYLQYVYLRRHPFDKLEDLYTGQAMAEQKRIQRKFQKVNANRILQPQNFFADGKTLEIEKLLRYVDIPAHQHDFIEFAYVFTGQCVHNINGNAFLQRAGSFVAIPFGYTHALFPEEDCLCLTIKIRNESFQKMQFPGLINFIYPLAFSCGEDSFVRNCVASIWMQQERNLPYCNQIQQQLFQTLMFYMEQNFHDAIDFLVSSRKQDRHLVEILSYMMDNYKTVTLQSVAEHFHYNSSYFCRHFHALTGTTFSTLVKEFRLRQAAQLLVETNRKLNDICDEVGYKDTTQFIRSFKTLYGVTPIQYRKQSAIQ